MIRVSSAQLGEEVGRFPDAASSEPVIVTRDGEDVAVLISIAEYERLKGRERAAYAAGELPDDLLAAVRASAMDARHSHFDDMIADWQP